MPAEITLGSPLIRLDHIDSTNAYAMSIIKKREAGEGTVILADFQTGGRGQKGNVWESQKGMNLTFSVILFPEFLEAGKQFYLLMSTSLGMIDLLKQAGIKAMIKWPNDICVSGKKISGILIENSLKGAYISSSIVGIGLNVNQTHYVTPGIMPTSVKLETGREMNCDILFSETLRHLTIWIRKLYRNEWPAIREKYLQHLWQYHKWSDYADSTGSFRGRITDILEGGELVIEKQNGIYEKYLFKEIEYGS
ncbi:MAG: biotin--[acetyl-CoA-carboxylase] ligase [Bacteroidales bacterium]|nr:biotin--[acetyl-CoA-carboxylase] ligase [Bacteroidales bacterium]MBN2763980.1 biotin--[acetyl-CoA-carboxylase] ligase [Bacteroidales bacterium]